MTANGWMQLLVFLGVLLAAVKPLGWYMARVYQGRMAGAARAWGWPSATQSLRRTEV